MSGDITLTPCCFHQWRPCGTLPAADAAAPLCSALADASEAACATSGTQSFRILTKPDKFFSRLTKLRTSTAFLPRLAKVTVTHTHTYIHTRQSYRALVS